MTVHIVLGHGPALDQAFALAQQALPGSQRLEVVTADGHNFDIGPLRQAFTVDEAKVFVALDQRAVNYARQKLIAELRILGYRTFDLVAATAIIGSNVRLMGNVYVGSGCNIADGCVLGMGSWLDRQVTLDREVKLGSCVSLAAAVTLAQQVEVGSGSSLGPGTVALPGSRIGKHCEWLLGGQVPTVLADRSFFDTLMPEGARILSSPKAR